MESEIDIESCKTASALSDGTDTKVKNIETNGCKVLPSESDSLKNAMEAVMQTESSFPQTSNDSEESESRDDPYEDNENSDDQSKEGDAQALFQSKEGKEDAADESKYKTQTITEDEKADSQSNQQREASNSQSNEKIMRGSDEPGKDSNNGSADDKSKASIGHLVPSQFRKISEGSENQDRSFVSDASENRKETASADIKERESSVESDDKFDVTPSKLGSDLPRIRSEVGPIMTGEESHGMGPRWTLWAPEDLGFNGSHNIDLRRRSDGHAYDCVLQSPLSGRKHSSGDLHSRLKTRKLLGVGETDDGDVHRSKLSQILGHSDQLYIRLPSGLRIWQIILALLFFTMALWAMVFPFHYYLVIFETQVGESSYLPIRMYAIALLSLSLVYWKTLQTSDKDVIRMVLLTTAVFFTLQTIVLILFYTFDGFTKTRMALLLVRAVLGLVTGGFYWELGSRRSSMRRTPSNKDLQEKEHSQ